MIVPTLIPPSVKGYLTNLSEELWPQETKGDMLFDGLIFRLSKGEANLFLLQCILSYGQTLESCLKKIYGFYTRTGSKNETVWQVIAGYSYEEWCSLPKSDRLHTMTGKHAQVYRMGIALVKDSLGDARGLWTGVTQGEVLRRLEEIDISEDSINKIIVAMIKSGLPGNDAAVWSPGSHAKRIIARILFGTNNLPEEVIPFIQEFFKKYGHILHRFAKIRCNVKKPLCEGCILANYCTFYKFLHETYPDENWSDYYIQDYLYCQEKGVKQFQLGQDIQIASIDQKFPVCRKFLYHYDRLYNDEIWIFDDILTNNPDYIHKSLNIRVVKKKMNT